MRAHGKRMSRKNLDALKFKWVTFLGVGRLAPPGFLLNLTYHLSHLEVAVMGKVRDRIYFENG